MNTRTTGSEVAHSRTPKRAQLIFHAEANPFGAKTIHEVDAERLFDQIKPAESKRFAQFVGFLCSSDVTYICLPKIFRRYLTTPMTAGRDELLRPLPRLLRQCLSRYSSSVAQQRAVSLLEAYTPDARRPNTVKPTSHLALAQRVLDDFRLHGLWVDSDQIHKVGGRGSIRWKQTIRRGGEYLIPQGDTLAPIYAQPLRAVRQQRSDHPLSLAQLAVLHDIQALYGAILNDRALQLPPLPRAIDNPRSLPRLGRALKRARRSLYQSRPSRLADLLLSYIELDHQGRADQIDIYGTTSFELVFEQMCAEVFQSDLSLVSSEQLGRVEWSLNPILSPLIGQTRRSGRAQEPDLVVPVEVETHRNKGVDKEPHASISNNYIHYRISTEDPKSILLLDAKYYDLISALEHSDRSASHLPGVEDIRKQYTYARWIEHETELKVLANALLFPTVGLQQLLPDLNLPEDPEPNETSHPFESLGTVALTQPKSKTTHTIHLLGVNLARVMYAYGRGVRYETLFMRGME